MYNIESFIFFTPFLLNAFVFWVIFAKVCSYKIVDARECTILNKFKSVHGLTNDLFMRVNILFNFFFLIWIITLHGVEGSFWWNHFFISNFAVYVIWYSSIVQFLSILFLKNLLIFSQKIGIDWAFIVVNLWLFVPFLFLANSIFTLFFILEVINILIFYMLVNAQCLELPLTHSGYVNKNKIYPKLYLKALFLQYWISFFSSTLFMFVIIYFMYIYGSTEWLVLNLIYGTLSEFNTYVSHPFHNTLCLLLTLCFIVKLGTAPFHLYKIELYKFMPLTVILYYTIFFFTVYFTLMCTFVIYYGAVIGCNWLYIEWLLVLGGFYLISLLFDNTLVKSFIAYSSILNIVSFLIVLFTVVM